MSPERIAYSGSLDLSTVPEIHAQVEAAARQHREIVLDLSGLEFIDSTGVNELIALKRKLADAGHKLKLEALQPEILDVLDILGVKDMLLED